MSGSRHERDRGAVDAAIGALGLAGAEVTALEGGIANRSYRLRAGPHDLVLRIRGEAAAALESVASRASGLPVSLVTDQALAFAERALMRIRSNVTHAALAQVSLAKPSRYQLIDTHIHEILTMLLGYHPVVTSIQPVGPNGTTLRLILCLMPTNGSSAALPAHAPGCVPWPPSRQGACPPSSSWPRSSRPSPTATSHLTISSGPHAMRAPWTPMAMPSGSGINSGSLHMLAMSSVPTFDVSRMTVFLKSM